MPRRSEPKTARENIRRVVDWVARQKLHNVAAELRAALNLLPEEPPARLKRRP
jgi:hypothetical protein